MSRRRAFLRVGSLGLAGLSLPELLRRRACADAPRETAVIQVFLGGGLSHLDSYDPKPDAPAEFRGELGAIRTAVPGVSVSELLPRQAQLLNRMVLVRGLHHTTADHADGSHWVLTGYAPRLASPRTNERPSVGSVASRLRGAGKPGLPAYVALPDAPAFAGSAYLGPGENPFGLSGGSDSTLRAANLDPPPGVGPARVLDRRTLLRQLDQIDPRRDHAGLFAGLDQFTTDAYAMITGPAARAAFDLEKEAPATRARYGETRIGRSCLLARRLVEAGVTFVTVNEPGWDHHGQVAGALRKQLPPLDAALAVLVDDLHDRGLAQRVLLLVWGEFGRTPRVNGAAGRDHWPGAFTAVLAGGGLKTGLALGSTGRKGEAPADRPVTPADIIQTVYHVLGIDPDHAFRNEAGRPMPVLDQGRPLRELL